MTRLAPIKLRPSPPACPLSFSSGLIGKNLKAEVNLSREEKYEDMTKWLLVEFVHLAHNIFLWLTRVIENAPKAIFINLMHILGLSQAYLYLQKISSLSRYLRIIPRQIIWWECWSNGSIAVRTEWVCGLWEKKHFFLLAVTMSKKFHENFHLGAVLYISEICWKKIITIITAQSTKWRPYCWSYAFLWQVFSELEHGLECQQGVCHQRILLVWGPLIQSLLLPVSFEYFGAEDWDERLYSVVYVYPRVRNVSDCAPLCRFDRLPIISSEHLWVRNKVHIRLSFSTIYYHIKAFCNCGKRISIVEHNECHQSTYLQILLQL